MKNIGFIIPSLKNGGAERVLSTITDNLDDKFKQFIFTWNKDKPDYEFKGDIIEIKGKNSKSLLKNFYILFKRVLYMRKYKKQYKIDTCISHLEGPNIVNLLSKVNEKTIITVHNFQSKERSGMYGYIFKTLIFLLYNKADKIVVVSDAIKKDLINKFNINPEIIQVIYNPIDCKTIEELSNEKIEEKYKKIFENNNVIINVGRLTYQKGQWNLIKSFYLLKKKINNVKLVILGQGELDYKLKELICKLNLEEDVFLLGFQKNPFKFISKSTVFALTSDYEGFPMCLLESMSCGTPIVSVDCDSGPIEILSENKIRISGLKLADYGILVEGFNLDYNNVDDYIGDKHKILANGLEMIINNIEIQRKYIESGKIRSTSFDVNNIIKYWEDLV